jgi:hypothetical protein
MDTYNVYNANNVLLAIIEAECIEDATVEAEKLYSTEIKLTKEE